MSVMAGKKRKSPGSKARSPERRSWGLLHLLGGIEARQWFAAGRRAGRLLVLLAIVAAVWMGVRFLDGYVHRITRARQVELTVTLVGPPRWASKELIEEICLSSGIKRDDFLLDEDLTGKWARNLSQNPWVKRIKQVRKRYNGQVDIDCELREPVAAVYKSDRMSYVDAAGVVLPAAKLVDDYCHVVRLQDGLNIRALPEPGQTIRSKAMIAGLEVLNVIRRMDEDLATDDPLWPELAVLDVSNFEGQVNPAVSHLTMYTRNETEVRWGAALGRSVP